MSGWEGRNCKLQAALLVNVRVVYSLYYSPQSIASEEESGGEMKAICDS